MKVTKVDEISPFDNAHGVDARKIYDSVDCTTIFMCLKPGEALNLHTTPVDVFFYILDGNGAVVVGKETQKVSSNTLVDSPKGIPHLLKNTGTSLFKFLVVKLNKSK
jgi:mannose-6-phosphate isomerase-like protein (cupin superfamily)